MKEYIIIPDIHADIDRLERSLEVAEDTPAAQRKVGMRTDALKGRVRYGGWM